MIIMDYFFLTLKHKWFVFCAGLKLKVPMWRLIKHDLSKLSTKEYKHYQKQFFGQIHDEEGFAKAWLHHQNHNDHHWEYWISRTAHFKSVFNINNKDKVLEMPEVCVREMIADWIGASRAYESKYPTKGNWNWLNNNLENVLLSVHPNTAKLIRDLLTEHDYL